MKKQMTKRLALLLALIIAGTSFKPAFLTPVYGEPVTVSAPAPEAGAVSAGTVSAGAAGEAGTEGQDAGTVSQEGTEGEPAVLSGNDAEEGAGGDILPEGDADRNAFSDEGVVSGGTLKHEYYDGVNDRDGMELVGEYPEYEEAAGGGEIWDEPTYNSYFANGRLDINQMKYISPVRDQGYTGLCWMYGSVAAVESGLIKKYEKYGLSWDQINLSEKHGAYYMFNKSTGSLGKYIDDDYFELRNAPTRTPDINHNLIEKGTWNGYIRRGGHGWMAMEAFTSWKGLVDEDDTNTLRFKDSGTIKMMNEEPRLDDSKTYDQKYQVQNADFYPYPWKEKRRNELKDVSDLKILKEAIVKHGALAGSMNTRFFDKTNTYAYHPGDPQPLEQDRNRYSTTTHLVTFVGWDDTVPKEKFSNPKCKDTNGSYFLESELTPPGDGAWICKNSWDVSGSASNGFFYISYYDGALRNKYNCFSGYDTVIKDRLLSGEEFYDNNYQYNGLATRPTLNTPNEFDTQDGSKPVYVSDGKHFGSVYVAKSHETLKAVGITTRELSMGLKVKVYTASDDSLPPLAEVKGTVDKEHGHIVTDDDQELKDAGWSLSAEGIQKQVQAGFHTIELNNPVKLSPGQHFLVLFTMECALYNLAESGAIVIRQENTAEGGKYCGINRTTVNGDRYYLGTEYEHKKASCYSFDDLTSTELEYRSTYDYDIRAFTKNGWEDSGRPVSANMSYFVFDGEHVNLKVEQGDTVDMNEGLIFEPVSNNGVWDEVSANSWKSEDESILKNLGNGMFEAVSANKTPVLVSVSTVSGVTAQSLVTVTEPAKDYNIGVSLKRDSFDYTGGLMSVSEDIVITSGNTAIYKWENRNLTTVSGFNISISENGAINAGEAVVTVNVTLSGDSVSKDSPSAERLLATEDILFNINPIDIGSSPRISYDGVADEYTLSSDEIRPDPDVYFTSSDPKVDKKKLVSFNGTNGIDYSEDGAEIYLCDYVLSYYEDLKTTGPKFVRLDGCGNFTGTKYLYWDVVKEDAPFDDTAQEEGGLYVSKVEPRVVEFNGNKHVSEEAKKKSGYECDLSLTVKYDGRKLTEGKDYQLKYKNNVNASTGVQDDKDKPYVVVTGLGKYKGLSATRYFAIDPAPLTDDNTAVTGLKALYPVNDNASAKVKPAVTFSFTDSVGKTVNRKLKEAVTRNNKTTGDYKLVYYRYIFPEKNETSGEGEDVYVGEWKKLGENDVLGTNEKDMEYYAVVAEGIGNYKGASAVTGDGEDMIYPWPGAEGQFIVCKKSITPGNGQLKGTSIKSITVPETYKKLTVTAPYVFVDDLWEDPKTIVNFAYKKPDGKSGSLPIDSNESKAQMHYMSLYDKSKKEVSYVASPGTYTLRTVVLGEIPNGTMKGQTSAQALAATKDVSLKVTSGEKLKATDFTLEYSLDGKEWKTFERNLKLDYDGTDTSFRIKKGDKVVVDCDDYFMAGSFTNNAFPGKYTLTLQGQGLYGTSKLNWSFTRNRLPLDKALKGAGGKLEIVQDGKDMASVFGTMPGLKITDGYRNMNESIDSARQATWYGLEFSAKNNKKPGTATLVIKANAESPYSGKGSIEFKIDEYDLAAQAKGYNITDISTNAVDNKDRIFGVAEDAYSEAAKPVVKLYQYNATGLERKEVTLDKGSLSISKDNKGNPCVKITSDKDGLIKFPADGMILPIRVLDTSRKAKKLQITKGTFVDDNFLKQGAVYTGRNICPTITEITADGRTLTAGQFTIEYENNVKVGTAKITVRALGTASDTVSGKQVFSFKIKNR